MTATHEPEAVAFCQQVNVAYIASQKTMRQCAKEIGVAHGTFCRIVGGKLPDLDTYFKLRRWLRRQGDALARLEQLVAAAKAEIAE